MKKENETVEAELVDEEFKAPVLKSAKELSTLVNVDTLVTEYKELSEIDINLPVEVIAEQFLSIEKAFKEFRKARTSIEAKRKELGEPAFKFHKKVIEIAKDVQNIINPYENKLKALVDKVENEEKRKQLEEEMKEIERVGEIKGFIETLKNTPMNFFNSSSEDIMEQIQALEVPATKYYDEFLDEALEVYKVSMSQLESMHATKVQAEGAEEAQRKVQDRLDAEELERKEEQRLEREALDAEKAQMQREREAFARQQQEHQEAIDLKNAEIENERIAKEQEEARLKQEQFDADEKKRIDERMQNEFESTVTEMESYDTYRQLLHAIYEGRVKNLTWEA